MSQQYIKNENYQLAALPTTTFSCGRTKIYKLRITIYYCKLTVKIVFLRMIFMTKTLPLVQNAESSF